MTRIALALALVVFPLILCSQQRTGSIAGSVLLDSQVGLEDSRVVYSKVIRLSRDSKGSIVELEPHVTGIVRTGANGTFRIDSLPSGSYYLCALPAQANQIKSCDSPYPPVSVREANTTADVALIVRTGVLLSIVIDDASTRITPQTLAVGWMSPSGAYSPATQSARTADRATLTVAIPRNSSGHLFLDGSLTILDASGAALRMRGRSVPVTVSQESDATVALRVQ